MGKRLLPTFILAALFIFQIPSSLAAACDPNADDYYECVGSEVQQNQGGAKTLNEANPLPPADNPSGCSSQGGSNAGDFTRIYTPPNCLFLGEPIGGETGYDLYKYDRDGNYSLWNGELIDNVNTFGPVQAVLTSQPGREYQGAFGLLYNYVGLIYKYMSGLIVGFAVLLIVIGGIQITMAGADAHAYETAKGRITKAIMGVIIWFLASLILYTINPTFFTF